MPRQLSGPAAVSVSGFVTVLAIVLLHERLTIIKGLALGAALVGTALTVDRQVGKS